MGVDSTLQLQHKILIGEVLSSADERNAVNSTVVVVVVVRLPVLFCEYFIMHVSVVVVCPW